MVSAVGSLLLEDATRSLVPFTVEFCFIKVAELSSSDWLRFFWAVWRRAMVLGGGGREGVVSSLGLFCKYNYIIVSFIKVHLWPKKCSTSKHKCLLLCNTKREVTVPILKTCDKGEHNGIEKIFVYLAIN